LSTLTLAIFCLVGAIGNHLGDVGSQIVVVVVISTLIAATALAVRRRMGAQRASVEAHEEAVARYAERLELWKQLWYCSRDDGVFVEDVWEPLDETISGPGVPAKLLGDAE
jgi:hypothetical protein